MLPTTAIIPLSSSELQALLSESARNGAFYIQNADKTLRETYSFGYDYFVLRKGNNEFTAIPSIIRQLCEQIIESFGPAYELGHAEDYKNVILSIYKKGYQLQPHVDVDFSMRVTDGKEVNFWFGENILGLILEADSEGRLYLLKEPNLDKEHKIFELNEKSGLAYLLTGEYRRKPYYHGVSLVKHSRISLTFRTVKFT